MAPSQDEKPLKTAREKLIGLSLESTRKSYYPQLQAQMAELKLARERYQLLFDNANEAIFIAQDERIKFPNPKATQVLGVNEATLASRSFADFIHPDDRQMVLEFHQRRMTGDDHRLFTFSFRIIAVSGKQLTVQMNSVQISWEGRPASLCFLRDVTEQKKLEENLRQAQKLEALGTLAGGIAHDFNNLLMGIQGRISIMQAETAPSHPHCEHLREIGTYIQSAKDLTDQLLGLAKGGKYQIVPTNMNLILDRSVTMFGRTHKEIRTHRKLEKNLWTVEADRGQMNQMLLNLYVNAWQAMPGGGDLHVQSANHTINPDSLNQGGTTSGLLAPGRYVRICVTDSGGGIDPSYLPRIFDPFFTTKTMGRGTGLGLASVYGIIKNHGGDVRVYSEVGHGTTFTIYLPASTRAVAPETVPVGETLRGKETILLVDDETMIVQVGCKMLERLGYTVLVAQSGHAALEILQAKQASIDLIILDMIMPDLGGAETFDRIRRIAPRVKVLLSSGYSINGQAVNILQRGCDGFIQKPFSLRELSMKLREVIDPRPC